MKPEDIGSFFSLRFHFLMLVGLFLAIPARGEIGIDATAPRDQSTAKSGHASSWGISCSSV
jgi:hypothetical protein